MEGDRVSTTSTGQVPLDAILATGVRGEARTWMRWRPQAEHEAAVLLWNYHDVDAPGPGSRRPP